MRVNYIFRDGREQECFLPLTFPLTLLDTLLDSEHGIVSIEILSVNGVYS